MTGLAPDLAVSEINRRHATCGHQRVGEGARHTVDEHRARGEFRPGKRGADDGVVTDIEGHRDIRATRVVETVGASAETALTKVQHDALGLGPVVATGVKAQVPAADQAVHALRGGGVGQHRECGQKDKRKGETAYG